MELATHCMVLWIDNYNKWRYSRSVCRKRDISINATCIAALPVPYPEGGFPPLKGSLCIQELLERAQDLPKMLQNATRVLRVRIDSSREQHFGYDTIRAPLDIRRYGVAMAPRWTTDVLPCNVSARKGLLEVCRNLMEWRQHTGQNCTPILCDVDLYFRIHKLHKTLPNTAVDTGSFMRHTPLFFGLWHAYKYCLIMCYRRFLTFWAALEHKTFLDHPTSIAIRTNFNVGIVEHMVLSAFLISGKVTPHIYPTYSW